MQDLEKEFKPTSWSVDNKVVIYAAALIICLAGALTFQSLPKENFPEIVIPAIVVATIYPGAAPEDVENLISKQIEKQVKSITGVDKVTSNSVQDFSSVVIEFDADVDVKDAKREVQDAVDKAKPDLPSDLPDAPQVIDIDISSMPIMNINLSGDFDLKTLKKYADQMQDRIESLPEIRRVDIVGALDREIQVNVDIFKSANAGVSLDDISSAIRYENMIVSGGQLTMGGMKRSLSVNGEFHSAAPIENIVVSATRGGKIYLRDVADVVDSHKEKESYARLDGKNVITLNVVKRAGENLIISSDKINEIVKDFEANILPRGTKVTVTADQSNETRVTLHDLINTIIIGFILVSLILMFFMGVVNAVFVALSVPLSSFIAFLVFPMLGYTLNMMTLFSFLLALGIVVDDAIVVIENTHRIYGNGKVPIRKAAKLAAGEVFVPVLTGTLVVLAPFIPLAFWPGIIGEFMVYLPITLIVALLASLLVAYIINPVFAADFMVEHDHEHAESKFNREYKRAALAMLSMAAVGYAVIGFGFGNFVILMFLLYSGYHFYLQKVVSHFQTSFWPKLQSSYKSLLSRTIVGNRPWLVLSSVAGLFIFAI
ncbi:MAG: copper transporter, partial [Candidatus Nephrothrix sp. EaCA]